MAVGSSPPLVGGHQMETFQRWLLGSDAIVMTAICTGKPEPPMTPFETPAAGLWRHVKSAGRFQLMQLGICMLRSDAVAGRFRARPITIDVFPADFPLSDRLLLTKSLFDSDAVHMKALSDSHFDFNRVLISGMNWLSPPDEAFILETLKTKRASKESTINDSNRTAIRPTDPKDKLFVDIADVVLNKFCQTNGSAVEAIAAGQVLLDKIPVSDFLFTLSTDPDGRLMMTPGNGYLRRLLHQAINGRRQLQGIHVDSCDKRRPSVRVTMAPASSMAADPNLDPDEVLRRRLIQELDDADTENLVKIDEQVGFRKIVQAVVASGKPIFADNLLELLLHFELILEGKLERDYAGIKESLTRRWRGIPLHETSSSTTTSSSTIILEDAFDMDPGTMEAGVEALRRALKVDLRNLDVIPSHVGVPGSIALVCLNGEDDSTSEDVSKVIQISTASLAGCQARFDVEVLFAGNNTATVRCKTDVSEVTDAINDAAGDVGAITFRAQMNRDERLAIPDSRPLKRFHDQFARE